MALAHLMGLVADDAPGTNRQRFTLTAEGPRRTHPAMGDPIAAFDRLGEARDALERINDREPPSTTVELDFDLDRPIHGAGRVSLGAFVNVERGLEWACRMNDENLTRDACLSF